MKPTDLRIGNYLRDGKSKEILKVKKLTLDGIVTDVIDRTKYPLKDGWFLEPIEITEEWLSRFGFNDENIKEYNWLNWAIELKYQKDDDIWYVYQGIVQMKFNVICTIKYVHELQNLYKSITKEELV